MICRHVWAHPRAFSGDTLTREQGGGSGPEIRRARVNQKGTRAVVKRGGEW